MLHPAERGRELLRLFRDVMHDAPDELSLAFVYLTAPDEDAIPAELRGRPAVAIAGMHAGPIEDAERALAPIRAFGPPALDAFGPVGYADFQRSIDDPPGYRNWWTAEYLDDLTDDAIEAVASLSEQLPPGPAQIFIPAWGGAVARVPEDATPLAKRDARYVVHPLLLWEDAAEDERMIAFGRRYREVLAPHRTGGTYLNFLGDEGADRVRAAYGPNHERLVRVKAGWDPDNVFRATGNVRARRLGISLMCSRRPAASMPPHSSPRLPGDTNLDFHPALDPRRRLCGDGHAHAGHRGREHRAVRHRRRPQHGPLGPAVGRRRLHARARRRRADGRLARRPLRSSPALHHRSFHLHRHLARVRGGDRTS